MEGTGEVNETIENSVNAPHLKRKENEHSLPPENRNVMESSALFTSQETDWPEHLSLLRSHELTMDTLEDKRLVRCTSAQSGLEPLGTSPSMNGADVMVEELTLKNYKNPNMFLAGSSSSGDEIPIRKGLWHNLDKLAGGPQEVLYKETLTMGNKEDARNAILNQFWVQRPPLQKQLGHNFSKVSEGLNGNDCHNFTGDAQTRFQEGIRTKILPASGFPQFLVKNTLKGKGIAYRHSGTYNVQKNVIQCHNIERDKGETGVAPDTSHHSSAKADDTSLYGGGCGAASDVQNQNGISLREWLKPGHRKISKTERLHLFKQILELVDASHSEGVALQHLRPSYFMVTSPNQVKYVGSFVSQVLTVPRESSISKDTHHSERHMERKRHLELASHQFLSSKQHKLSEHMKSDSQNHPSGARAGLRGEMVREIDNRSYSTRNTGFDFRQQWKSGVDYKPPDTSQGTILSSVAYEKLTPEMRQLEERWYSIPEELSDNVCPFSANIYNLGVLLFELFCYFKSWEVHASAMSNLRHRILPPTFLSESPKEAGFCLWLLHPEPSSRPKSRDILVSDLMGEIQDFSCLNDASTSFEEEDAEAELLLHFLISMREQKEKKDGKLVEDIGCLRSDIEEVERRHSSRTEFLSKARDSLTSFCEIPDRSLHKEALHSEAISKFSSINQAKLMRNIEQLENAYFSMRSKIELPETNTAARSDKDVLKHRDRFSPIQTSSEECCTNKEYDCLGAFFDGLCKYARYSKFEVRGTLRNGDILNSANVICSLSLDRDEDYFAAAGVSKKIKIFDFNSLLNDNVDIHYPVIEMSSKSKLSCVCWNNYIKNYLASTDYEGVVQLWDASTGQGFSKYTEHQRRAWSVDFSQVDPLKLASGSDDCSVKLWSINEKSCLDTIRNLANVCCVQFSSFSTHLLAFGSADYKISCYDLRHTRIPWCTLAGHNKAVSYVKFVDSETLVSASTDNTLKLWDLNKTSSSGLSTSACSLTLSGHTNEKNFVGLSVSDGYIVSGSETNDVYAYYKSLPMPITSHKFGSTDPISGQEISDDNGLFVSSVCWRGKSSMVVAANSSGSIKLLELV